MTNITNLNDRRPFKWSHQHYRSRNIGDMLNCRGDIAPPLLYIPPLCPPERIDPVAQFEITHALKYEHHTQPMDDYGIRQMERETRIVSRCIYAVAVGLIFGWCLGWWLHP